MNKWFKGIVMTFMIVTLVFFPVAYVLPRQVHIERSIVVNAPPEHVFAYVNDPHQWDKWEAWNKTMDPTLVHTYAGADTGVGAERSWKGDKLGTGHQKITASEANKRVEQDLVFNNEKKASKVAMVLTPKDGGTEVKWAMDTDLGYNPITRYFGLVMDSMLGGDFEKGLSNLKDVAEKDYKAKPAEEKAPSEEKPTDEKTEKTME